MNARGVALLVLVGCARSQSSSPDASSSSSPPAPAPAPAPAPDSASASASRDVRPAAASPLHAQRARLVRLEEDPALAANAEIVRAHFRERAASQLAVQTVPLTEAGARAITVSDATRPAAESSPFVLVVDGPAHHLRWTKGAPAAGILAPFGPFAIASGPRGRVAFAVCDPPTKRLALRLWDGDGSAFADFDAMDVEDCTATSALYWPEKGWLVVASRPGQTRAQLVSEQGQLRWGRGIDIGARSRTGAAAALAQEGDGFVIVQAGPASGVPTEAEHAFAFHYGVDGAPRGQPRDLGTVPKDVPSLEPLPLEQPRNGALRVVLGSRPVDLAP